MLIRGDSGKRHMCSECTSELPSFLTVHCTRSRDPRLSTTRGSIHHGRRRWICPRCGNNLGCDECRGRFPDEVLCPVCRIYMDGKALVSMTVEERRLLIEMVPHSNPARAISLDRLALQMCSDPLQVKETIYSLRGKGIAIEELAGRYYLRPHGSPAPTPLEPQPGGIELSLPLGDRNRWGSPK